MKELSIEDKAKAYDEVREKIAIRFGSNVADEIFSQFEMSEDEKIRKELLKHLREVASGKSLELSTTDYERWATWVAKQGEQKSVNDLTQQEAMDIAVAKCFEQGEQKPHRMVSAEAKETMYNKSAWSEEDEKNLEKTIWFTEEGGKLIFAKTDKLVSWLKSLKDRYTWKPSDEQISIIEFVMEDIEKDSLRYAILNSILEQLKKLRE